MKKLISIFVSIALLIFLLIFMPRLTSQQLKAEGSPDFYYALGKIVVQLTKEVSPVIPFKVYGIIQTGIPQIDQLFQRFKIQVREGIELMKINPKIEKHFIFLYSGLSGFSL